MASALKKKKKSLRNECRCPYLKRSEIVDLRNNGGGTIQLGFFNALLLVVEITAFCTSCFPACSLRRSLSVACTTLWLRRLSPQESCPGSCSCRPWERRIPVTEGKMVWSVILLIKMRQWWRDWICRTSYSRSMNLFIQTSCCEI